jgi:PST family polysaccharide transporter
VKPGEIAHNVSRGAFYLAVEKAAALVSGIAYFALLLRWLGPTKYGIMTLALSFMGLATMATGNFEAFLERYAAEYQARGDVRALRRSLGLALGLKLGLGVLASVALLAIAPFLSSQYAMPELAVLLPVLAIMVAVDGCSTTGRATLYGLQRFRWISLIAVLFHVAKTVMVGLLWYTERGLAALAIGLVVLALAQGFATLGVTLWILRRAPSPAASAEREPSLRSMMAYCMPLLGARVTFISGQNLSKVVLGKLFDSTQLGYFSFAFNTVERFVELAHVLPSSLMPSLTHLVARGERARLRDVFDQAHRLIQVVALVLSFGLFAFAHEITLLVASPLFEPAVPLLRVLALVPVARTAQQPLTMVFQALRNPGAVLALAVVKFVGEFGSYFLLVPLLGLMGAGWANLVGACAAYAGALVLLARQVPEGAGERTRAAVASVALLAPALVLSLAASDLLPLVPSLLARAVLVAALLAALPATRLVVRYDLEKLAGLRVGNARLARARDRALVVAGHAMSWFEPRRAA